MKFPIGITLLFDIVRYRILAAMFSNSAGEVPVGPELPSPEHFLDVRTSLEDLTGSKALDRRYYLRYRVGWNGLNEEMDMILVRADFQEFHLVPILDLYAYILHHPIHMLVEYCTSILRGKNQMVYENCNIMALMYVLAHITTLRRKRRGIQPEGI